MLARSETTSGFRVPLRRNRMLVVGVVGAFAIHVLALVWAPLRSVLATGPVTLAQFGTLAVVALTLLVAADIGTAVRARVDRGGRRAARSSRRR